jgi:hypothetical protein
VNLEAHIDRLSRNSGVFEQLLAVSDEQARWKPDPDRWSLLEVANHLYDEEREDFRSRLDVALHHPDRPYAPIDPMGWVSARAYNEREVTASVEAFLAERDVSLGWLAALTDPDWTSMAAGSRLSAGDLMVSWVAHDFFHLRQISTLHWDYLAARSEPFATAYAGTLE